MFYREHPPHPSLRPVVRCFWRLGGEPATAGSATAGAERVLPDGCAEIVINRADRFRRLADDGDGHLQAEVLLVGQISRALTLAPQGEIDLLGIRFEPAGLRDLLGVPMHELTDRDLCLGQVSERLRGRLAEAARAEGPREQVAAVEAELWRQRCGRGAAAGVELGLAAAAVRRVVEDAVTTTGPTTADALAAALRVSRRTLERAFRDEIGLSPKLYLRIHRFARVIRRLDGGRLPSSWATLAAEHGYADQPHLIRDFRLLAGVTPGSYLRERTTLADLFSGGAPSHSSNP